LIRRVVPCAFISGIPVRGCWSVGLRNGCAVAGILTQPFTGEFFYSNRGNFSSMMAAVRQSAVCKTVNLRGYIFLAAPFLFNEKTGRPLSGLSRPSACHVMAPRSRRFCHVDCAGFVDLAMKVELKPCDIVTLVSIIKKTGSFIA